MADVGFFMRLSRCSKARASAMDEHDTENAKSIDGPSLLELWQEPRRCSPSLRSRSEVAPT